MSRSHVLTVVVRGLFEQLQFQHAQSQPVGESLLARIAGRGDVAHRWSAQLPEDARLAPWQYGLLTALSLPPVEYPSAPLCALGAGFADNCAYWIHADPIHLAAGLNDVALVPLHPAAALSSAEQGAMHDALAAHLQGEGLSLMQTGAAWLIGAPSGFEVETVHPQFAARHEWDIVLPQGSGANRVRRLTTEIQMVLHEHPANEVRAVRGAPAVNALWLWGAGQTCPPKPRTSPATCVGGNVYLRGICRANAWADPLAVNSVQALLQACSTERIVAVLDTLTPDEFDTAWLAPLLDALKTRRIDRLELVLDEWLVTIDRWRWRRIWRPASPFTQWASV